VLTAVPSMQAEPATSVAVVQWVLTGYAITFGGLMLLGGRVAGWPGGRRAGPPPRVRRGSGAVRGVVLVCGSPGQAGAERRYRSFGASRPEIVGRPGFARSELRLGTQLEHPKLDLRPRLGRLVDTDRQRQLDGPELEEQVLVHAGLHGLVELGSQVRDDLRRRQRPSGLPRSSNVYQMITR
jgi:hypothetical protein